MPEDPRTMPKRRFRVPHTLVLIFGMIVLAQVLTYVLPQGEFDREVFQDTGREAVVPGTYGPVDQTVTLEPWHAFMAVPRGFAAAADIIFFVFIVGGAFGVFRATGAADAAIGSLLRRMGNRPALLIVVGITMFMLGSSTIGMAEEYLPFVPLLLTLCVALGYDAVTAVGIMCVGYGVGYGTAVINPFTVIVAQNVAGVEQSSGIGYRMILGVAFLAIGIHHVLSYARRVKADPSNSLVADIEPDPAHSKVKDVPLTATHVVSLVAIVASIGALVWGIKVHEWYLMEMGAVFLGLTVFLGVVARLSVNETASSFCFGASELTTTALLIGFARTIELILNDGQIIDTIVHGISGPLRSAGPYVSAVGMYAVQSLCNLFIPSGSGQAYVTMPLMAPLADLTHVSRQVAVLAYQFGDGFTNIVIPTNAVLIGILTMARIPYERWLRFILPFMIKVWIAGSIALVIAVAFGYS
jgi:uncharacterized ion transporter superfamily protein YfcC